MIRLMPVAPRSDSEALARDNDHERRPLPTIILNNSPVRVPGMGLIGRVCGRSVETVDHEARLDVLDAAARIHRAIPEHMAVLIDDAECPVPRFEPRALKPRRAEAMS